MIYFVQRANGDIKIGTATDVARRIRAIQYLEGPVELLGVMPGSYAEERALHRRFKPHNVKNEWFQAVAELTDFVCANTCLPADVVEAVVSLSVRRAPHRASAYTGASQRLVSDFLKCLVRKEIRDNKRYTQTEIAKATGLSASSISRLMRGDIENTSMKTILTITDWLDCDVGDLVYRERELT